VGSVISVIRKFKHHNEIVQTRAEVSTEKVCNNESSVEELVLINGKVVIRETIICSRGIHQLVWKVLHTRTGCFCSARKRISSFGVLSALMRSLKAHSVS
jgi:hypothetical protein